MWSKKVMSIFTLGAHCSCQSQSKFIILCQINHNVTVHLQFGYPYNLQKKAFTVMPLCNQSTHKIPVSMIGDYSFEASLFASVCSLATLHNLVSLSIYMFFDSVYYEYDLVLLVDFVLEALFAILWPLASFMWTVCMMSIATYTNPDNDWLKHAVRECVQFICETVEYPSFASADVALIFGYLSSVIWPLTAYQLFRRTVWYPQWKELQLKSLLLNKIPILWLCWKDHNQPRQRLREDDSRVTLAETQFSQETRDTVM